MTVANSNELISRAQSGDEQAFADLIQAYYPFVYAIVIGIVSNPLDAEEVVQDTFVNAYRGLARYKEMEKFKSWLAKIARNCAHNRLRKQQIDTVPIDEVNEQISGTEDLPDEQLIRSEQRELIRRAMETLSPKDREIARSYYLDGASYDELIQTHGLSYKAISFRLSRAKRRLAKRLEHLLTGIFVSPATTLKQIYSGGLTVMKIGTAPQITVAAIAIVGLLFIGFIGSRQLLSSKDNRSTSVEAVAPTADTTAQSVAQTGATRQDVPTTPSPEKERPISEQERQQINNFFSQLEESDVQSEAVAPQSATESESEVKSISTGTDVPLPATEPTAEEVMNTFVEAFKNFDFEALLPLTTGAVREEFEGSDSDMERLLEEAPAEMEQEIIDGILETASQVEVTSTEYVGDEFHFGLRTPPLKIQSPEMRTPTGSERFSLSTSSEVLYFKMRKEDGVWRIYEAGPGN